MSREEAERKTAIEYIENQIRDGYVDLGSFDEVEMDIICCALKQYKHQHWIPCSERLPEDSTEVFVYLFDRTSPYIAWIADCHWFTEEFEVEKENYPSAWMPLPEPYQEEQDAKI